MYPFPISSDTVKKAIDNAPAKQIIESVLKNSSKIYETIRGSYEVYPPEITLYCPDSIQKFSMAFRAKGGFIPPKMKFPNGRPIRAKVRTLTGGVDLSQSLKMTDNGFELSTKSMSSGDLYLLDVEYKINDPNYLTSLVHRSHAKEIPKEESDEYWMHAELKHPNVLKTKYGKLDLQDLDFNVDVGISRDISTVIPESFKKELNIGVEILNENNPHKMQKLAYKRVQAKKLRGKNKSAVECLGDIQELFFPTKFCKYIEVDNDFRFSNCHRGNNFDNSLPLNLTWPKTMKVVSRADLNLENCAVDGTVKYRKKNFIDEISKIIGKV